MARAGRSIYHFPEPSLMSPTELQVGNAASSWASKGKVWWIIAPSQSHPFYRWVQWGLDKSNNLDRNTQQEGRYRIWTFYLRLWNLSPLCSACASHPSLLPSSQYPITGCRKMQIHCATNLLQIRLVYGIQTFNKAIGLNWLFLYNVFRWINDDRIYLIL